MDNTDAYLKLIELEMKLYNTVNEAVINAVTEKYKNIDVNRIRYSLPIIDNNSNSAQKSTPSSIKSREDRLKYMKKCQENWGKKPNGGPRK